MLENKTHPDLSANILKSCQLSFDEAATATIGTIAYKAHQPLVFTNKSSDQELILSREDVKAALVKSLHDANYSLRQFGIPNEELQKACYYAEIEPS